MNIQANPYADLHCKAHQIRKIGKETRHNFILSEIYTQKHYNSNKKPKFLAGKKKKKRKKRKKLFPLVIYD